MREEGRHTVENVKYWIDHARDNGQIDRERERESKLLGEEPYYWWMDVALT